MATKHLGRYVIRYGDSPHDQPRTLTICIGSDAAAIVELRTLVAEGSRNQTWATMELPDGSKVAYRNEDGDPKGVAIGMPWWPLSSYPGPD
jgi:hypothetical protein